MTLKFSDFQLRKLLVVAISSFLIFPCVAQAGNVVSLGPLPYLEGYPDGSGDIPAGFFDFTHAGCVGWIEDFELGTLDDFLSIDNGEVLPPNSTSGIGTITDSVDGDDGVVDGDGNNGYSWFSGFVNNLTVTFDDPVRAAGLVFTDGDNDSTNISLEAFDVNGVSLGLINAGDLADDMFTGETAEDRFLGFTDDMTSIKSIKLSMDAGIGIEVDHIHWQTECVPEPSSQLLSMIALLGLVGFRRRR